jgi:hypothetical protein
MDNKILNYEKNNWLSLFIEKKNKNTKLWILTMLQ